MGYSPRGHKESDTTERLHFHFRFNFLVFKNYFQANTSPTLPGLKLFCRKFFEISTSPTYVAHVVMKMNSLVYSDSLNTVEER